MINYSGYKIESPVEAFVIDVTGRLDTATSEYLLDCVQGYIDQGERKLILNCAELEYISSMGIATLVRANSRLKNKQGRVVIVGLTGIVADAIRLVRLDRLIGLFGTVDEATAALAEAE